MSDHFSWRLLSWIAIAHKSSLLLSAVKKKNTWTYNPLALLKLILKPQVVTSWVSLQAVPLLWVSSSVYEVQFIKKPLTCSFMFTAWCCLKEWKKTNCTLPGEEAKAGSRLVERSWKANRRCTDFALVRHKIQHRKKKKKKIERTLQISSTKMLF